MGRNVGPLVLTVVQFVSAAVGYLLVVTLLPTGVGNRRNAVLAGVIGAAVAGSLLYYSRIRPAMPDRWLDEEGEREPVEPPPGMEQPPGALGAEDLPGPASDDPERGDGSEAPTERGETSDRRE